MSKFLSLLCSLLICVATYAQEITVNGKVTANGEEMPGVTVAVKGGTHGTITSIDGSYSPLIPQHFDLTLFISS